MSKLTSAAIDHGNPVLFRSELCEQECLLNRYNINVIGCKLFDESVSEWTVLFDTSCV